MKHRTLGLSTVTCLAISALALGVTTPAGAGSDTTPPTLSLPPYATFVVGSQVSDTGGGGDDPFSAYSPGTLMQQKVGWSASDASGICGYDVSVEYAGLAPESLSVNSLKTKLVYTTTDYDDQFGGGSFKVMGFDVLARDCAGNTTTRFTNARPIVTQEDGWTFGYPGVSLAYSGTWGTSTCTCWSADQTRKTSQKGAKVWISKDFQAGESIALVMETAPDRGAFKVFVDGHQVATVNTHATVKRHRVVVWAQRMAAGPHTVKLVNKASAGHPRIDLDAVLTGA